MTGQLGDVMKESSDLAYTFAKHFYQHHILPSIPSDGCGNTLDPNYFDSVSFFISFLILEFFFPVSDFS